MSQNFKNKPKIAHHQSFITMNIVPFSSPYSSGYQDPYYSNTLAWPEQFESSLGWPQPLEQSLGFPADNTLSMMPASMRRDPLMRKTVRNAKRIVAPLKQILRADVIDKGDSYEVHAGTIPHHLNH